jgi:hypothetical protein
MSGLAAVLTIACSAAAATEWEGLHRRPSRTHVSTHSTPMGGTAHTQAPSARQHAPRATLHAVCKYPSLRVSPPWHARPSFGALSCCRFAVHPLVHGL